jgi:hypothetical protein
MVNMNTSSKELHFYMIAFLFCVSSYTIITKYQDITEGVGGRTFQHPYWQTFVTAFGDSLALLIYLVKQKWYSKPEDPLD